MFSMVHLSIITSSTVQKPSRLSNEISKIWKWVNHVWSQIPCRHRSIGKFQHQNNISVHVYGCEDQKIFLLGITTMRIARHRVNLLYITAGETSHYVLLKDLSRLIQRQNNNTTTKDISGNIVYMTKSVKGYWKKTFGKMQDTRGTKNEAPRNWRQEGAWQS